MYCQTFLFFNFDNKVSILLCLKILISKMILKCTSMSLTLGGLWLSLFSISCSRHIQYRQSTIYPLEKELPNVSLCQQFLVIGILNPIVRSWDYSQYALHGDPNSYVREFRRKPWKTPNAQVSKGDRESIPAPPVQQF